jgi:hypothetical protein
MRLRPALLLIAAMTLAASDAFTHPLPDSQVFVDVGRDQVDVELRLPAAQFEIGFGKPVPQALTQSVKRDVARYVADHLTASSRDGTAWCTEVRSVEIVAERGAAHSSEAVAHLYVKAVLVPPAQPTPRNFVLRTDLVVHELLTHQLFVYLRRDWKVTAPGVEPFLLGRITYRTVDLAVDLFDGDGK